MHRVQPAPRAAAPLCAATCALLALACSQIPRLSLRLPEEDQLLNAPGAPEGCRSAYVLPAAMPFPDARDRGRKFPQERFRQLPGELLGLDWGACTWMGPEPKLGDTMWVFMIWRPAWRGPVQCRLGNRRSPLLLLGSPDTPADSTVKVKWYEADEGAELLTGPDLPIPTRAVPCQTAPPSAQPP